MWGAQPFTFAGRHFRTEGASIGPPPQAPRVPLLIAGGGERVTLRQVAQYADMCNIGPHEWTGGARTVDDVRRKLTVLRRHCAAVGRPPEAILTSHITLPLILTATDEALPARLAAVPPRALAYMRRAGGLFAGTAEQAIDHYRGLAAAGMQYFIVAIDDADHETVELLGTEVIPALAA